MMRKFLSEHLFSPLQGMSLGTWWTYLRRNRFAVDPPYWPRAAFQTANSVSNSMVARWEKARWSRKLKEVQVHPPLFILGHFRSGTTHLHNLLALDPQFTFPTLYQTLYPNTFLTTEATVPRLGAFLLLRTRPHDNVAIHFGSASEDELAILNDSLLSPYLGWTFPRNGEDYDRYLTLRGIPVAEVERWKSSLHRFLQKVTLLHDRPIVLKSPPHTARIGLLLELFPEARFIHIRRDPYTVFRSTRHMYKSTMKYWQMQRAESPEFDDRIISVYRATYDAYFDQRAQIPPGRLCEIAYEDLERDPLGQLEGVYASLGLSGFSSIRPQVEEYLSSIAGYRKNQHADLPEPIRQRLEREWRRSFDEWGYRRSDGAV